nr:uncharacterized protein LOC109731681 isoform X2 [Aegilops tauschii subsp. strangulata]
MTSPAATSHLRVSSLAAPAADAPAGLLPGRSLMLPDAGGPPEEGDQEGDWAARRLDQRPGDEGDPEDTGGPLLGRRGQWQRQPGLENLRPCAAWSGAGEGDACGVAAP